MSKPDLETLSKLLDYDPETGLFRWRVDRSGGVHEGAIAGCATRYGYRRIGISGKSYMAHRLAWLFLTGQWPENDIDHINGNRSDNRACNLRPATRTENFGNKKIQANNKLGFKGAWKGKGRSRYMARLQISGKPIYLGYYDTPEEAHEAYCKAAIEHFGEYARFE